MVIDKLNNNASGPTRQALDHRGRFVRITLEGPSPKGGLPLTRFPSMGFPG